METVRADPRTRTNFEYIVPTRNTIKLETQFIGIQHLGAVCTRAQPLAEGGYD